MTITPSETNSSNNGVHGFFVFEGSHLKVGGMVRANGNDGKGIEVSKSSQVNARPNTVLRIDDNFKEGLHVSQMSQAVLSQGESVTIEFNHVGIVADSNSLVEALPV